MMRTCCKRFNQGVGMVHMWCVVTTGSDPGAASAGLSLRSRLGCVWYLPLSHFRYTSDMRYFRCMNKSACLHYCKDFYMQCCFHGMAMPPR